MDRVPVFTIRVAAGAFEQSTLVRIPLLKTVGRLSGIFGSGVCARFCASCSNSAKGDACALRLGALGETPYLRNVGSSSSSCFAAAAICGLLLDFSRSNVSSAAVHFLEASWTFPIFNAYCSLRGL